MKFAVNVGFISAVLVLLFVGLVSIDSTQRLVASQQFVGHTHEVREALLSLTKNVSDASAGRRAYVITGDPRYLGPYLDLARTVQSKLAELRRLTQDNPHQTVRLATAAGLIDAQLDIQRHSIAYSKSEPQNMAVQSALTARGTEVNKQLDSAFAAMADEEARLLRARVADQKHRTDGAIFVGIVGTGLGVTLLSAVVFALRGQVIRRSRAESELAVKSGILESVLASMTDGVVVADEAGTFLHYNQAARRMTGRASFDVSPEQWPEQVHMFRSDRITPYPAAELPLARAIKGQSVEAEELYIARQDRGIWLEITGAPLKGADGRHIGGVVVMRDSTERRETSDEIERLNRQLAGKVVAMEAVNKELEAFSYSVSHDLRSPLRSIDGFSQALVEDYRERLDADGIDFLNRICAAAQRMGALIDDMLTLSRITRQQMAFERVDLSACARSVVEELRAGDPEREVTIEIADGIQASGDRSLLRALLTNLIANAWKFTSRKPHPTIEVGVLITDSGEPACFVRDNGAGFDPAYKHKLFGAFQRLHAMSEFAGTGIGLATVQRVILRHGGRIWAEGAVDQGATFFFTLPDLGADQPQEPTDADDAGEAISANRRGATIEDTRVNAA